MPWLPVSRNTTLSLRQASIMAVAALDDLVHELVSTRGWKQRQIFWTG